MNSLGLTKQDFYDIAKTMWDISENFSSAGDYTSSTSPEDFRRLGMSNIENILNSIKSNPILSLEAKKIVSNELRLIYIDGCFFNPSYVERILKKIEEESSEIKKENIIEPEKSYYSFLKELKLNNPDYLQTNYYSTIIQDILKTEILNIHPIEEQNIETWLANIKKGLENTIGYDDGTIYKLLVTNSYGLQLQKRVPLSELQILNIKSYFKEDVYSHFLLAEDQKLKESSRFVGKLNKYASPDVDKEQIIDYITEKYKGNIIVVDFWATWCAPCMASLKQMEHVKKAQQNKQVKYVYLTNSSSPKELWDIKTQEVGGEHYYLDNLVWEYLFDKYQFTMIPTYLIFNKKGELTYKSEGFPGVNKMNEWITSSLD